MELTFLLIRKKIWLCCGWISSILFVSCGALQLQNRTRRRDWDGCPQGPPWSHGPTCAVVSTWALFTYQWLLGEMCCLIAAPPTHFQWVVQILEAWLCASVGRERKRVKRESGERHSISLSFGTIYDIWTDTWITWILHNHSLLTEL